MDGAMFVRECPNGHGAVATPEDIETWCPQCGAAQRRAIGIPFLMVVGEPCGYKLPVAFNLTEGAIVTELSLN